MSRNVIETIMGAVVLLVAGGFLIFAYRSGSVNTVPDGYVLHAKFDDVGGIGSGSDVRIGGVKVGVVEMLSLDKDTYQADMSLRIESSVKLPSDTTAAIVSAGLLGGKFVSLVPGADNIMLAPGERVRFTQSSVNIEDLIGRMVFSGGGVEKDAAAAAPGASVDDAGSADKPPFSSGIE